MRPVAGPDQPPLGTRHLLSENRFLTRLRLELAWFTGRPWLSGRATGGAGVVLRFERVRPRRAGRFQPLRSEEITPKFLDRTIRALKRWKFDIVSMDEVCHRAVTSSTPGRFVSLTFDGGSKEVLFSRTGFVRLDYINPDGARTTLASAAIPKLSSDWFEVVVFSGPAAGVYLNGKPVLSYEFGPGVSLYDVGLVTHVTGDVGATVAALCDGIRMGAPRAVAETKRMLRAVPDLPRDEAFERMRALSDELFAGPDAAEGMAAFAEKRPPAWQRQ